MLDGVFGVINEMCIVFVQTFVHISRAPKSAIAYHIESKCFQLHSCRSLLCLSCLHPVMTRWMIATRFMDPPIVRRCQVFLEG
jgi:hypothetical protein